MEQQNLILRVSEDDKKNAVLEVMGDKYCRDILRYARYRPKSVVEISNELKIPISTVYRRLPLLQETNMISVSGQINPEGKKYFLYKTKVKEISAQVSGELVDVKVTQESHNAEKL